MSDPYREGKPLAELIPPDRRREKTILVVVASMLAGIGIYVVATRALAPSVPPSVEVGESPFVPDGKRFPPVTLSGPDGSVRLPASSRAVVHVWLQKCADCMPAFEAMRDVDARGGLALSIPEYNVAYGSADPAWAAQYGVRKNLLFDRTGAAIVRPLGISSFTTLVIDENGVVLHRDRPDRPGYADRIRAVVGANDPRSWPPRVEPGPFDDDAVVRVVRASQNAVRRTCWDSAKDVSRVDVTVHLQIGADGHVVSAAATGSDGVVGACVARVLGSAVFPPPGETKAVDVPFHFVRE